MDYAAYQQLFTDILTSEQPAAPYNNPDYLEYTRLNLTRMNRWEKTLQLDERLVAALKAIDQKQHWIFIVEPWCGDVAHLLPFLHRLAAQNPLISYELQLRDSEPFLINDYLTRGTKSIPKLIVRNAAGEDLFTWGPRPKAAQQLMDDLKAANVDFETIKTKLQSWYNADKGKGVQEELLALYTSINI